jgi:hypothetical protein
MEAIMRTSRWCLALGLVLTVSWGTWAADEHGDSPLTAHPIAPDGRLLEACIEESGDMDFFLFEGQSGRRYLLQARRASPDMDAVLFLFGSDGQTILEVSADAGDPGGARIEWPCPRSGTYFVMVRHALSTTGTGCYELSIGAVQVDDHGDEPLSATPIAAAGAAVPGFLETAADIDVFLMNADKGYDYTAVLDNLVGGVIPTLRLLAPDGETVLGDTTGSSGAEDLSLDWTAQESGTHFLRIGAASGSPAGGYDLSVSRAGYGDDHPNTWTDATSLPTDGTLQNGRIDVPGDIDVFGVTMREGGQYTIAVRPADGNDPLSMALLATDGTTRLATSTPVAGPTGEDRAELDWTASSAGTFYVEVRHALGTGTGGYTIAVQSVLQLDVIGEFNPQGGYTLDLAVVDSRAFLIVGSKGLLVVDLSDPGTPMEIGSYSTPGYSQALAIDDRRLFMANRGDGISILDISDPARPHELGRYDTMGSAQDVVLDGSMAYIADQRGGLVLLGVANPSSPQLVGSWTTRGYAEGVAVADGIAYVATGDVGLEIIDVSQPDAPRALSELDLPGEAHAVVVLDGIAYVAAGYRGIRVIDVSDPSRPAEVNAVTTAGEAHGLYRIGNYLYVADYTEGLAVFSLVDRRSPQVVARVDTPGYAVNVYVNDDRAYVADRENGVRILAVLP